MIITIARQCGCGAAKVGRLLSEHYHIPFYTRKQLMEMARERGCLDDMADFFDERPVDELLFAMTSYGESRMSSIERPLQTLARMIGDEDCIIIGRCGNHIFRQRKDLVSVFLKADLESRIREIMDEKKCSRREAEEFVENTDDCRVAYHRYYTGLTWGNAADYDLCLDSSRLGMEYTAEMIEAYADKSCSAGNPKSR